MTADDICDGAYQPHTIDCTRFDLSSQHPDFPTWRRWLHSWYCPSSSRRRPSTSCTRRCDSGSSAAQTCVCASSSKHVSVVDIDESNSTVRLDLRQCCTGFLFLFDTDQRAYCETSLWCGILPLLTVPWLLQPPFQPASPGQGCAHIGLQILVCMRCRRRALRRLLLCGADLANWVRSRYWTVSAVDVSAPPCILRTRFGSSDAFGKPSDACQSVDMRNWYSVLPECLKQVLRCHSPSRRHH